MTRVRGFNHFSVTVADMDESLTFWRDLLELEETGRGTVEYEHLDRIVGHAGTVIEWAELKLPTGGLIELFRYHRPTGTAQRLDVIDPGSTHICLEVSDLDGLMSRLDRAGFHARSGKPVTIPFGDWEGFRCVYVSDPNGVTVELSEPPIPRR
jgi:catechol 2,3-dioxygenase-like lactoylglutathione lyase family enzyme